MQCNTMIAFFLICVINHVYSSALRDGSPFPYRAFERDLTINPNYGDEQNLGELKDFDFNYYEDKFQDGFHRKRPRRIFNWINNNIIRSNNSDQVIPKATEANYDVLDDKIRLLEMGGNLTVTLTQISSLLMEILDIIKHNKQNNFKPLHDVIKTTNFNNDRYKRDANVTAKGETVRNSTTLEKNNERDSNTNNKELESDEKRNVDKVTLKKALKVTLKDKAVLNNTNQVKNNERLSASNNKELKRNVRRNCDKYIFKRHANATKDESDPKNTKHDKGKERDNTTTVKALERDGRRNLDIDRYKRDVNETVNNKAEGSNGTKLETANERENTTNDMELERDGRRKMPDNPLANSEVKERLLHYINEGFDEIKNKIASLKGTKDMFSNDVNFKIGYIIASLDSLGANMKNLRSDMERNKFVWNDKRILNLYDTVKSSNNAVGSLMEVLKSYVDITLT